MFKRFVIAVIIFITCAFLFYWTKGFLPVYAESPQPTDSSSPAVTTTPSLTASPSPAVTTTPSPTTNPSPSPAPSETPPEIDHYKQGQSYMQAGNFSEAAKELLKALEKNPDQAEIYFNLGKCYHLQGDLDSALTAYKKTVELDPNYAEAHGNMYLIYHKKGMYTSALKEYWAAAKIKKQTAPLVLTVLFIVLVIIAVIGVLLYFVLQSLKKPSSKIAKSEVEKSIKRADFFGNQNTQPFDRQLPFTPPKLDFTEEWFDSGYRVLVIAGPDEGKEFVLGQTIGVIGRLASEDDNRRITVFLTDNSVSKEQAVLTWNYREKFYNIIHNESATNATLLNDQPINPGEKFQLKNGDLISVGRTIMRIISKNTTKKTDDQPEKQPAEEKVKIPSPSLADVQDEAANQKSSPPLPEIKSVDEDEMLTKAVIKTNFVIELVSKTNEFTMRQFSVNKPILYIGVIGNRLNDIELPAGFATNNKQARLVYQNGVLSIVDESADKSTMVNEIYCPSCALEDGDEIRIGDIILKIVKEIESPFVIEVAKGLDMGKVFPVNKTVITIGRRGKRHNDIDLSDVTVSRRQARIVFKDNNFHIVNESDVNPLYIDNKETQSKTLVNGDMIEVGATVLLFRGQK